MLLLDTENGDRDLAAGETVLTDTPSTTLALECQAHIAFGDGSKNLDGVGGDFELTVTVGGNTVQPSPQIVAFGTEPRAAMDAGPFAVPANQEVTIHVKSPNAADTDVDVTATLYDLGGITAINGVAVTLATEFDANCVSAEQAYLAQFVTDDTGETESQDNSVAALSGGEGGITYVLPGVSSPSSSGRIDPASLTGYQHTRLRFTRIILDSNDTPIDLSGVTVLFRAWDKDDPSTVLISMTSEGAGAELTIAGDDDNEVTADGAVIHTATARQLDWGLYDGDEPVALDWGVLKIEEGPDLA